MSHVPDYEAKYRDKLLDRARAAGVESVDALKQKLKDEAAAVAAAAAAKRSQAGGAAATGADAQRSGAASSEKRGSDRTRQQ
ncbi:hypothetical protein LPJ61_005230, partial [Coemansia biformis]